MTLSERLEKCSNRPAGFDYIRLILASCVVWAHTINALHGEEYTVALWATPVRGLFGLILPMFFALSGFLVASSLERSRSLISFMGLRVMRIWPALAVDTVLGALILGPIFTILPLTTYFRRGELYKYLLNITGDVHFTLPGVFENTPLPKIINVQLWTLPYELICYLLLAGLALVGITRRRGWFMTFAMVFAVFVGVWWGLIEMLQPKGTVIPLLMVECFLFGVTAYLFRDRIPHDARLFGAALVASFLLLTSPMGDYFAAIPVTYVTAYLGLLNPPRSIVVSSGDYSYGIYLYGFPVQQTLVALFPTISWPVHLIVSYVGTLLLAIFSWRCVELQALKLRPALYAFERRVLQSTPNIRWASRLVGAPADGTLARPPARQS